MRVVSHLFTQAGVLSYAVSIRLPGRNHLTVNCEETRLDSAESVERVADVMPAAIGKIRGATQAFRSICVSHHNLHLASLQVGSERCAPSGETQGVREVHSDNQLGACQQSSRRLRMLNLPSHKLRIGRVKVRPVYRRYWESSAKLPIIGQVALEGSCMQVPRGNGHPQDCSQVLGVPGRTGWKMGSSNFFRLIGLANLEQAHQPIGNSSDVLMIAPTNAAPNLAALAMTRVECPLKHLWKAVWNLLAGFDVRGYQYSCCDFQNIRFEAGFHYLVVVCLPRNGHFLSSNSFGGIPITRVNNAMREAAAIAELPRLSHLASAGSYINDGANK